MSNVIPMADMDRMAAAFAKSGLFGVKSPEQALSLMALCQAEGLHPATAVRDYHIIQGRPALKSDALLARFQAAGGRVEWVTYQNDKVIGRFTHPAGGSVEVAWTMQDAARAGLASKDNWKQYPRAMLRARVLAEGIRTVFPGVAVGTYTVEELRDLGPSTGSVDLSPAMTQADECLAILAALTEDELKKLYIGFFKLAKAANDADHMAALTAAKDQRKAELSAVTIDAAKEVA